MTKDLPVKRDADVCHEGDGGGNNGGDKRDHTYSYLGIFALSALLGGMTYSLLSPFYTKEAVRKGCSVTETGIVSAYLFINL